MNLFAYSTPLSTFGTVNMGLKNTLESVGIFSMTFSSGSSLMESSMTGSFRRLNRNLLKLSLKTFNVVIS